MIERLYAKDVLSFSTIDIEFFQGLHVFTGASGAGKSLLIQTLLSVFGRSEPLAKHAECSTLWPIESDAFENEESNIFKLLKKEKSRFFVNAQAASKKTVSELSAPNMQYLSTKEYDELSSVNLLRLLELWIVDNDYFTTLSTFQETYTAHQSVQKELSKLTTLALEAEQKREFLRFEIEKIEKINPIRGEDESLMAVKKQLSKREKIEQCVEEVMPLFEFSSPIAQLQELTSMKLDYFDEALNQLRIDIDLADEQLHALDDVNIEEILDRIEALSDLKRRFGSIDKSIDVLHEKKIELESLNNISHNTLALQEKEHALQEELVALEQRLTTYRKEAIEDVMEDLNTYISALYLPAVSLQIEPSNRDSNGCDHFSVAVNGASLKQMSSGEFNRLRLALLAARIEKLSVIEGESTVQRVLILDEIDANLSGEESMSVARVLRLLSKAYQIFAISHQPQLSAMGEHHYLVSKESGCSSVRLLTHEERIDEIARIVGSNEVNMHATAFAKELLEKTM